MISKLLENIQLVDSRCADILKSFNKNALLRRAKVSFAIKEFHKAAERSATSIIHHSNRSTVNLDAKKKKSKKRFCIFCKNMKSCLSRHITKVHNKKKEVVEILKLNKFDRIKAFSELKAKGIYEYNISQVKYGHTQYERERKSEHALDITCCDGCKKFVSKINLYKHSKLCIKESDKKGCSNLKSYSNQNNDENVTKRNKRKTDTELLTEKRAYYIWLRKDEKLLLAEFHSFIVENKMPSKKEIVEFLENDHINVPYTIARTKLTNERVKFQRKKKNVLKELNMSLT